MKSFNLITELRSEEQEVKREVFKKDNFRHAQLMPGEKKELFEAE